MHESKLQTAQPVQLEGDCYKWNVKQRERKVVQQSFLRCEEKVSFRTMTETVWFLFLVTLNFLGSVLIRAGKRNIL